MEISKVDREIIEAYGAGYSYDEMVDQRETHEREKADLTKNWKEQYNLLAKRYNELLSTVESGLTEVWNYLDVKRSQYNNISKDKVDRLGVVDCIYVAQKNFVERIKEEVKSVDRPADSSKSSS